jgi:putative ABC transport system permease protein
MIQNYFIIMARAIRRQLFQTGINVLGLTVAFAFALLLGLFISGEIKVNTTLRDAERLFLLENKINGESTGVDFFTPAFLTKIANDQYGSQFNGYYRFWDRSMTVSKDEKHFRIQGMIGDPSFLQMFGFNVLHGNKSNPLDKRDAVIVTEAAARLFFDRTDVDGETLSISTEQRGVRDYVIAAVISEPDKKNTVTDLMNMNAQIFLSLQNVSDFFVDSQPDSWQAPIIAYVKLDPQTDETSAETILNELLQEDAPKEISENRVIDLLPLTDYYMVTNHGAVKQLVSSLTGIIVFILLLAITNFINVTIASSFRRLKEIGIRKVIGSEKRQLVFQFLMESILLSFIAMLLSLVAYQFLFPLFNSLLNSQLPSLTGFEPLTWIVIFACAIMIGAMAGIYPALRQSAVKPIVSLKGKAASVQGTVSFSRVLIGVQFVITTFILIATIVLARQSDYFLERDLGYNKSHVIIVSSVPRQWNDEGFARMESAKTMFKSSSGVEAVSLSWGTPGWGVNGQEIMMRKEGTSEETSIKSFLTGVDESFDDVYQLKLLSGEFLFADNEPRSSKRVVLNETAATRLSVRTGDRIKFNADTSIFTVAGVVQDFHYESMHEPVKPAIFMHNRDYSSFRLFSFRLQAGTPANSLAEVERLWKQVFPDEPFTYYFADERLRALYTTELQLRKASTVASVLMLVIVMIGVLGLVSLNVSRRNKEVGIRKALGATVSNILVMFSGEYARLMLISFGIAIPLAYYFVNEWLNSFVYHIDLHWWMFLVPSTLLVLLTTMIVMLRAYGTASTNPVASLRYE